MLKSVKKRTDLLFFIPLVYMFSLSYLTYLNLTSNTEVFGYYAYLQFFSIWRSLKPFILVPVFIKILFFSEYSDREKIISSLFLAGIYCLCRFCYPNYFLLYAVAFCLAAKEISYHSIARTYLICSGATLLMTFLLLAYGLVEDNVITRGSMVRHSLGLVHPNSLGMWGLLIIVYYLQMEQPNIRKKDLLILAASIVLFYSVTGSRASGILSVLVLLSTFLVHKFNSERDSRTLCLALLIGVLLVVFIWLILVSFYTKESRIYLFLDKLTSGRLHLSRRAFRDYPLSLFGHNIVFQYHVDPLFTYTLVIYGLMGLVIFQIMFHAGAIRAYRKALPYILIAMLALQLYNTQENVFLYHLLDPTMFVLTCDLE